MSDLPDGTRKYVLDQTEPSRTLGQTDARQIKGVNLLTPTIAGGLPISIENPAIAYDEDADAFRILGTVGGEPVIVTLSKVGTTALTARDWSLDFAKLQNIPTDPATESGVLADLLDLLDTRVPADPAKESGKLTNIETLLTAIKATDGIKKIVDAVAVTNTGLSYIPSDPAKESGKLTDIAGINFVLRATGLTIYNTTMTSADTEYSQALPASCKRFTIGTRDRTAFRLAFTTGKVATPTEPYLTVPANETYYEDSLLLSNGTIYFASDSDGKVVEIIAWA